MSLLVTYRPLGWQGWIAGESQTLDTIELLSMVGDDGNGGYPVVAAAPLGGGELVVVNAV